MDRNALLYYQSARALRMPLTLREQIAGFEINIGQRHYFFRGAETPFNHGSSVSVASNKYCMNKMLAACGFPVPNADAYSKEHFEKEKTEALIRQLSFPLVVKPTVGTVQGTDVICNINTIAQLNAQMKKAFKRHNFLSVEEFHGGLNSYRVLVFFNKVIGVVQRFPARIVGDGVHTVSELVAITNEERASHNNTALGPIKMEEEFNIRLKELNITPDTIPEDKETIVICYVCNSPRGGTTRSLGKKIDRGNARLLCRAAKALDLNLVGFDVECSDIMLPMKAPRDVIIEANHNPDITIHENPMTGDKIQVTKIMLRRLIWKHPVAYLTGLCQSRSRAFYVKSAVVALVFVVWKSMV